MATSKIQTGLRVHEEMYEIICIIAKRETRSINAQIEYFIKKGIEAYERENGPIDLPKD